MTLAENKLNKNIFGNEQLQKWHSMVENYGNNIRKVEDTVLACETVAKITWNAKK